MRSLDNKEMIELCLDMACKNVETGNGGPFSALVVKNNEIVGTGVNRVTISNDPTAHAEVEAIRDACNRLGTFDLEGSTIYCSCEPCPMCLGAIYWSRITNVIFMADRHDAERAGFDDAMIYREIGKPFNNRELHFIHEKSPDSEKPFTKWAEQQNKISY